MKKLPIAISVLILLIVIFSGCNEKNNNDISLKPTIILFYPTEYIINESETTTLFWEVNNAEFVSIDNGIGVVSSIGNKKISPIYSTNYTLTATYGKQEESSTIQIIVNQKLNNFVGTWKLDEEDVNETLVIYNNRNALETIEFENGTKYLDYYIWDDNGSILCLTHHVNPENQRCGVYDFSDDFKSFTWEISIDVILLYNKIS
jgi:hypothetical protein